ncbi:methyltransferase domain-containing protein [Streptomyces sp. NPDC059153]|uniref:methyltransferase domain-containing protein n=1 Tax=Streptomyces sp. NPDC059153 TaxID=3346743 RepID=UPI0036A4536C
MKSVVRDADAAAPGQTHKVRSTMVMRTHDGSVGDADYGTIGAGYAAWRRPDERIAHVIAQALGDARTVLNVGAGTGSYETAAHTITAVEPSLAMRAQRPAELATAVEAVAEDLPFPDGHFDASMTLFSVHQWSDATAGLREMRRVTRGPVVVLTCDPARVRDFWLYEYGPDVLDTEARRYPPLDQLTAALDGTTTIQPVPIPLDCADGFNEAYYGRPNSSSTPQPDKPAQPGASSTTTPAKPSTPPCAAPSARAPGTKPSATSATARPTTDPSSSFAQPPDQQQSPGTSVIIHVSPGFDHAWSTSLYRWSQSPHRVGLSSWGKTPQPTPSVAFHQSSVNAAPHSLQTGRRFERWKSRCSAPRRTGSRCSCAPAAWTSAATALCLQSSHRCGWVPFGLPQSVA